jgi:hypothetical protein
LTNNWTNYTVQAQVQFPLGAYGAGVGGRLNPVTGARYAAWIYPEGSPGGSNVLKLLKFQNWTSVGYKGTNLAAMQQASLAAVGTNWHTLNLGMRGPQLVVCYDGNCVVNVTDTEAAPYLSGGVSLEMWTAATPYVWSLQGVSVISAPAPVIGAIDSSGTTVTITWDAVPGQSYRVQYKDSLGASNWNDWVPDIMATNGIATAVLTIDAVAQRTYRVMLVP